MFWPNRLQSVCRLLLCPFAYPTPSLLQHIGLPVKETTTSTALSIAVASLLSGVFSNLPFVLAPSGLNGGCSTGRSERLRSAVSSLRAPIPASSASLHLPAILTLPTLFHTCIAYLVYSEVLGRGVALPAALACCMTAAGVIALLTLLRALSLVLALVPNTVRTARCLCCSPPSSPLSFSFSLSHEQGRVFNAHSYAVSLFVPI